MARYAEIGKPHDNLILDAIAYAHPLIVYPTVVRTSLEGIAKQVRRSHHIVKKPDFAEIKLLSKMKPEPFVAKRFRRKVQEFDLALNRCPNIRTADLCTGQTGLSQQCVGFEAGVCAFRVGEARNSTARSGQRAQAICQRYDHAPLGLALSGKSLAAGIKTEAQGSLIDKRHGTRGRFGEASISRDVQRVEGRGRAWPCVVGGLGNWRSNCFGLVWLIGLSLLPLTCTFSSSTSHEPQVASDNGVVWPVGTTNLLAAALLGAWHLGAAAQRGPVLDAALVGLERQRLSLPRGLLGAERRLPNFRDGTSLKRFHASDVRLRSHDVTLAHCVAYS
jgi:hypothetical protein